MGVEKAKVEVRVAAEEEGPIALVLAMVHLPNKAPGQAMVHLHLDLPLPDLPHLLETLV